MAYNHGREDRKWRIWKEAEEKVLREHGVDEAVIEQIRMDDRADFNSNRRFYRWTSDFGEYLEGMADAEQQTEPNTVADLLDEIEDEKLYQALLTVDKHTLLIYPAHSPAENAGVFHKGDCGNGRAYRKGGLQTP
ncbi:RNA polymerase subunit sigma-70 [Thomasclavelia cocleata]|uniref:RNA polymerase subunit sigma-70 n=1 Tax=Thomasclavelia cocleata TaxID=69824 RepID=UPI003D9A942E